MAMIELVRTPEPTEGICLEQGAVKVIWEGHNFGYGTLYLSERFLAWISDRNEDGFTLTYPSIGVYGVSTADAQYPDPNLFMVVDLNKTNVSVVQQPSNDSDEDEGLAEDGSLTATLRLIPDDSNSLNLISGLMQQCHLLNPDAEEEMGDPDYSFADHIIDQSGQVEADDSWFTGETADDEIRLSGEGRANLERIVGDLNLSSTHTNSTNGNQSSHNHQNNGNEDEMEH